MSDQPNSPVGGTSSPLDVLREFVFYGPRGGMRHGKTSVAKALVQLETLVEAAQERLDYGHNDTCDLMLGDSTHPYPCVCGHHRLREALAPFVGQPGDEAT